MVIARPHRRCRRAAAAGPRAGHRRAARARRRGATVHRVHDHHDTRDGRRDQSGEGTGRDGSADPIERDDGLTVPAVHLADIAERHGGGLVGGLACLQSGMEHGANLRSGQEPGIGRRHDCPSYRSTIRSPTQVGGRERGRGVGSMHEPDRAVRTQVLVGGADRAPRHRRHGRSPRQTRRAGCAEHVALVLPSRGGDHGAAAVHVAAVSVCRSDRLLALGRPVPPSSTAS